MRRVFVDTSYLGALANPRDRLHEKAVILSVDLRANATRYVTTLGVLAEFLTLLSQDPHLRTRAADLVERMRSSDDVEIVSDAEELFDAGFQLYRAGTVRRTA